MLTEIILAGFGGQGLLFTGKTLAYSGMNLGREISWLPSYGPEMRGGTANCSVCLSDKPIGSPLVTDPDILVVMNTPSFDRFEGSVKNGGQLFVDCSMTDRISERKDISCTYIPATDLAAKNGLEGMANIIILGKMLSDCRKLLPDITPEVIKNAFKGMISSAKSELIEKNIKALEIGMSC